MAVFNFCDNERGVGCSEQEEMIVKNVFDQLVPLIEDQRLSITYLNNYTVDSLSRVTKLQNTV